jgi:prefoldin subunit 2
MSQTINNIPLNENQVIHIYQQMKTELQQISTKLGELEMELNEHNLVISTIEKLEPTRKCFRLIGGVLIERTVSEVLPAVKKNKEGISEIIQQLEKQYEKKGSELNDFIIKYKIRVKGNEDEPIKSEKENKPSTATSSSVLV